MTDNNYPQAGGFGAFPGGPMGVAAPPVVATKKGRRSAKRETRQRRSPSGLRWLIIVFAAAAGLLGVLVTLSPAQTAYVVRTAGAVTALTPLSEDQFTVVAIDPEAVEADTINATTEADARAALAAAIADKWFVYPVPAGQQVRISSLVTSGELAVPLAVDERLLSITARVPKAVAGGIRPGNLVDVYVSDGDGLTGLLGYGVEIVSVSLAPEQLDSAAQQQFDEPEKTLSDFVPSVPVGGTYVIRIQSADAARYIAANTAGEITLVLQGADAVGAPSTPVDLRGAICGTTTTGACFQDGQ